MYVHHSLPRTRNVHSTHVAPYACTVNSMRDAGAEGLAKALRQCPTIVHLDLAGRVQLGDAQ